MKRPHDPNTGNDAVLEAEESWWGSLLKLAFLGMLLVMACRSGGYHAGKAFFISNLAGGCLLLGLHYAGLRLGGRWMLICRVFVALWCFAYGIGGAFLTYAAQKGAPDDVERSVIPWLICLAAIALGLHWLIKAVPRKAPRSA